VAGPGCVDFLGAASRRRRHGKPIRWSDARASRFLGDPRVQVGGLSRGSLVDGESTSLPREVIVLEKQDTLRLYPPFPASTKEGGHANPPQPVPHQGFPDR
jgi:hypothetical protein